MKRNYIKYLIVGILTLSIFVSINFMAYGTTNEQTAGLFGLVAAFILILLTMILMTPSAKEVALTREVHLKQQRVKHHAFQKRQDEEWSRSYDELQQAKADDVDYEQ